MPLTSDVNNRSEFNVSMKKGTINTRGALCSIIKDEVIISDDSDFLDIYNRDEDLFYSQNNVEEIEDITINSGEANKDFFVEKCDSDAKKTMSNNSTIDHIYNDKKVSEFSQCGITTNELMIQTELGEATKSFTCSACSFKCCSKNNLEYHVQNDHKIFMKCAVTSKLKEKEMSKSMNHSSNKRSAQNFSKINRAKNIELYCVKCENISVPATVWEREICGLCNTYKNYQCRICKKQYTRSRSIYRHLKNECINIEPQYKCSQCDYKAKQKGTLQRHVESKHTIKKCTKCNKIFNDVYSWRTHKLHKCSNKVMHNFKYTCSQCDKMYMNLKSFNNHKKHLCELHFECNHCSYSTNRKHNLQVHIKSQHSEIFVVGDSL